MRDSVARIWAGYNPNFTVASDSGPIDPALFPSELLMAKKRRLVTTAHLLQPGDGLILPFDIAECGSERH